MLEREEGGYSRRTVFARGSGRHEAESEMRRTTVYAILGLIRFSNHRSSHRCMHKSCCCSICSCPYQGTEERTSVNEATWQGL